MPPGPTDHLVDVIDPLPDHRGTPGRPYEPVGHAIARQLRAAIIEGRLPPGARIRQEALAQRFGTSRIPVREALNLLESEGLVVLVPHSGARVARLEFAELTELYRIREALEPLAIRESTPLLTDVQLTELRELAERVEQSAGEPHEWLECDRAFHVGSYAAAPLPRVLTLIESLWNTTQQYRRAYLGTLDVRQLELVDAEHRLILDALERRDAEEAETLQRSHIRRTRITLIEHAELFHESE